MHVTGVLHVHHGQEEMNNETVTFEDVRGYMLAAIVHQARQPVFVLQNDLFAVKHLVERIGDTPDSQLLRDYVSEMRTTLGRLSASLSQIADFSSSSASDNKEISVKLFLEETFQIARFCVNRYNVQLSTDVSMSVTEHVTFDAMKVRITVIQWVLRVCDEMVASSPHDPKIVLTADSLEGEVVISWIGPSFQRRFSLPGVASDVAFAAFD